MLTITPINQSYYNKTVSFRAKPPEPNIEPQTPKEYSYAELYAQMQKLEIADIVEQEVIPAEKGTEDIQNLTKAEPVKLEILPVDNNGLTELHDICWKGDLAEFNKFIKKHPNFDPNQHDSNDWSYIRLSAAFGNKNNKTILNILAANKNIDLNITDSLGFNDLHQLCYYGPFEAVKIFVENHPDFDINQRTKNGSSYIDIAEIGCHHDIANYLTKYTQNYNQKGLKSYLKHVKI